VSKNVPKSELEVYLEDNKLPRVENSMFLAFGKRIGSNFICFLKWQEMCWPFPDRLLHLNLHLVLGGECLMHIAVHLS